jgi:hypothetical protein
MALGDGAVKRNEFRIEVAARLRLRHEMVTDGKADAPVSGRVRPRAVNETHVAQWSEVKRTSGQGSIAIRTAIAAASQGKTVGR